MTKKLYTTYSKQFVLILKALSVDITWLQTYLK